MARPLYLLLGLMTLAGAWLGPLPELAHRAFFAHMIMHMSVVALAPPLLALGFAGGRYDPVGVAPKLFAPVFASSLELIFVWGWHAPVAHNLARHSTAAGFAEQGMFLASGLWLWMSAIGGDPARENRGVAGVAGLLLTSMHMTLLGALLAVAPRPLYLHSGGGNLSALADQHLGGAIMILAGGASYLAGGLYLLSRLLRNPLRVQS